MRRSRIYDAIRLVLLVSLTTSFLFGTGLAFAEGENEDKAPAREILEVVCTQCHSLGPITMIRDGVPGWKNTVKEMVLRGAHLNLEEIELVSLYLAQNYGPGMSPMQTGIVPRDAVIKESEKGLQSQYISLPAGQGQNLVQGRCALCHDLGRVVSVRREPEDWHRITVDMTSRGIPASPQEISDMAAYLVNHFGEED